jgi:hypothetical protein
MSQLLVILGVIVLLYLLSLNRVESFRSKCFSCEAQDQANGIVRGYGAKCFSCEAQDRANGIARGYGAKCFSCGN